MYTHILAAVDGSKSAEKAFQKAVTIAKKDQAKLSIVFVADADYYRALEGSAMVIDRIRNYGKSLINSYQTKAEESGVEIVQTILGYGSPKIEIAKHIAPKHDVDLIVCGAAGTHGIERLLIGSVSENITRHAKCDVLVVRN
ncbi:universal stress protein [Bacillus taeanensis]|uniref:Universal stress protein n=1 Tax=Bacillus taeanensis TaxID=273032 RepID=A0A366XVE9_9BACI|nr:universal stress protein [Bacillus taeanensis]RBW69548.1 universal stress protein UspA [Bacillus taeanensis]